MADVDADVAVTESFIEPMDKCLKGEDGGEIMVKPDVKRELEQVQEKGMIVGSMVEPTQVYMDDVDRLDHSFYSSGVLGSEEEETDVPKKASYSDVSDRVPDIKISMTLETRNGVLEGNSSAAERVSSDGDKDAFVHLKAEALDQRVGITEEEHLVLDRVPEIEISTTLESTDGLLEASTSAAKIVGYEGGRDANQGIGVGGNETLLTNAKTDGENLENLDVPAGSEFTAVVDKSFDDNQEFKTETAPCSSNEETIDVDENNISVMDNDVADTVGEVHVTEVEKKSSGSPKEDENMEPAVEVSAEDGQLGEADLKPSQGCADDSVETTAMEVEEVLKYEEKVAGDDEFCDNSSGESQELGVDKINKSSFTNETQVMATDNEFPLPEVVGEATLKKGKENLTSEVNGDNCLHKDEEQLNTATIEKADAEHVGFNGRLDTSVIDSQEIPQVPIENASPERISSLQNSAESEIGTSGGTTVDDPSVYIDSSNLEPVNLEAHMACSDQPSAAHVSNVIRSDEVVVTEEITKSVEAVEQISHEMVLNSCTHGSCVVDLDICISKDKELAKEDIRLEDVESHMMTDAEFSEYFDSSANSNGEICLDTEVQEEYIAEDEDREMNEQITGPEQGSRVEAKVPKETTLRPRAQVDLANHLLPEESEAEFSVSDLVWGKVKSHPWWPGQICDPEDASEKAMQHRKKDSYLVAYFGDRTFAWNDPSVLKPFWSNFSHIEKQSSSEVFQNAINSALDEVSRRIMLGLACSCIPNDIYSKVECQIVENTGIREESSRRYDIDESTGARFLRPDKLVQYMRALAESPSAGTDRLGLVIAKAQLLAFNQTRGHYSLPEFQYCGGLVESDDADNLVLDQVNECTPHENSNKKKLESENRTSHKRKHNLKDGSYSSKRERRLSEIMGDEGSVEQDKKISFYAAKVSSIASPVPKPSFKVGDCIRRAASQLTGSLSIRRNGNENLQKVDGTVDTQTSPTNSQTSPVKNPTLDEMLLQLQMLARDPVKGPSSENSITTFFSGFRDSIRLCQYVGRHGSIMGKPGGGRKRKVTHSSVGSPEEFEFDDVSDSYWTDMIIQNHSEEQTASVLKRGHYEIVTLDAGKSQKSSQRGNSRKRFSTGNHQEMAVDEPVSYIDQMRQANLPTELILNFSVADSVPTEKHLNKTFRRFGPLKENETEIDPETSRARVVFKRCSDAEVAYNSSGKFSIFSPVFVNYQLNYTPSISFNSFPLATSEGMEDAG